MMKEIWRPVRGYEDWAEISNLGQIHYYATGKGRYPYERWTYGSESGDYLRATIGGVDKGVHVWVFMTFNDCDIPKGMEVNHIDEDKHNNCVWNLNLMTRKENLNWGTHNERMAATKRGKPNPKVADALRGRKQSPEHIEKRAAANSKAVQGLDKITGEVVFTFPSAAEAERQYGFSSKHITACCRGERRTHKGFIWRHIL